jgi:hypothetical protein
MQTADAPRHDYAITPRYCLLASYAGATLYASFTAKMFT